MIQESPQHGGINQSRTHPRTRRHRLQSKVPMIQGSPQHGGIKSSVRHRYATHSPRSPAKEPWIAGERAPDLLQKIHLSPAKDPSQDHLLTRPADLPHRGRRRGRLGWLLLSLLKARSASSSKRGAAASSTRRSRWGHEGLVSYCRFQSVSVGFSQLLSVTVSYVSHMCVSSFQLLSVSCAITCSRCCTSAPPAGGGECSVVWGVCRGSSVTGLF